MADKIHKSSSRDNWDLYWSTHTIDNDISTCHMENLHLIFDHFLPKRGVVLEAGSGLSKWVVYLRRLGYNIFGCDNNILCLSKVKEYDHSTPVFLCDVQGLSIKDNFLDAYISLGVIEHFEEGPHGVLNEAYRALKPGGLAFIEVPCLNLIRQFLLPIKKSYRWARKRIGKHPSNYYFSEYRYSRTELERFVRRAGFKIIFSSPKDLILPKNNIGLWLDFPFLRAGADSGSFKELNLLGTIISKVLRSISLWITCGCVICIARKEYTGGLT